ncbi:hypothetical protein VPH35_081385 [Triticum aestivum]
MLGVNPSQHGLVQATVAAASTGSSVFPRMVMPDSPRASACNPVPGFHVYPQASRLSGECSPRASACNPVAPSTPAPAPIDLNATPVVGGSSSGDTRKRARQAPAGGLPDAHNLFEEMSSAIDEDYMQHLIFEGGTPGAGYDPEETQSQDGRGAFTPAAGYDPDQAAFMCDRVGIDLDGFPLDHEFPDDYALLGKSLPAARDEEKFKAQYAALKARGGKGAVEDVGEDEPARPRGKTNSKKEDKRDAATNALIASVDGMMNKKGSREEERRRFKAEQMDAFMEIQRRRLHLDAEKQAKMFELEAEKQAKMLEIDAANAKTKAKEVALASMMTGVEIMKVDLNALSPRKRPWFEKMQADMLKFNDE